MIRAPTSGNPVGRLHEHLAVGGVEAPGDLAGQLDVLALVVAHRHLVGAVEQDVGRLQHRVQEQARAHQFLLARGLLLELVHALEVAVGRDRAEQPAELRVLVNVGLAEEDAARRVEARGQQRGRGVEHVAGERLRLVGHARGVEVHDAVDGRVAAVLALHVLADGPEVVAEVLAAGGLDAAEDAHGAESARGLAARRGRSGSRVPPCPAHHRPLGRAGLVEAAHRGGVRGAARDLRVLARPPRGSSGGRRRSGPAAPSSPSRWARSSAPPPPAAGSRRWAGARRGRAAAWPGRASSRPARRARLGPRARTRACRCGRRPRAGTRPRPPRRAAPSGSSRSAPPPRRPRAGRRRPASGCTRRSARTPRSCPGSRAACRSTSAGRSPGRSAAPSRCRPRAAPPGARAGRARSGRTRRSARRPGRRRHAAA